MDIVFSFYTSSLFFIFIDFRKRVVTAVKNYRKKGGDVNFHRKDLQK